MRIEDWLKSRGLLGKNDWLKRNLFWSQLGKPSGPQGAVIGRLMTAINAEAHNLTLAQAGIGSTDTVLEIGFGGGGLVRKVIERNPQATVRGVDVSETMIRQANDRNAAAVREGRAELRYGRVSALPYQDETFDKALSVHSIYFWPEPMEDLEEVLRVLKPGGLIACTVDPDEPTEPGLRNRTGFARWDSEMLVAVLKGAGFVRTRVIPLEGQRIICVTGYKPDSGD